MANLYLVRGIPGAGKSTFAKANFRCLILENDMWHESDGKYQWNAKSMKDAVRWVMSTAEFMLANGRDVCVCNTFVKRASVEVYRKIVEKHAANFIVYRCTHDYGNIHNVPKHVLESMKAGFEDWPGEIVV